MKIAFDSWTLGWEYEDIVSAAGSGDRRPGRVILTGALDDSHLGMLIKSANLVVIPSMYEGFCLPMVEAMACGVPTIVSNGSCLPEVSGGGLEYFDPGSTEGIAASMEQTLESEETRRSLSEKGRGRASGFSWRRCAAETLEILKSHAAPRNGART
jgi:glycosyltransferase involved in cell wall biosynthesis